MGPWPIFLLHAALVLSLVSPADIGGRPIANVDYSPHFYEAVNVREHLVARGSLWGWNPFWMAGYPEGVIGLIDNKLFFAALLPVPAAARAATFNFVILLSIWATAPAMWAAARLLGRSRGEENSAALLAVVATFTVPVCQAFFLGGTVSFLFASALSVPCLLGLVRAIHEARLVSGFGLAALAASFVAVVAHPGALFVLGPGLLAAFGTPRRVLAYVRPLTVVGLVLLLPNLPLFSALFELRAVTRPYPSGEFMQGGLERLLDDWGYRLLRTEPGLTGGVGGLGAIALLAAFGGGRGGMASLPRDPNSRALAAALVGCLFLAYGSSGFSATRLLQPYRFLIPATFLLCLPAARGFVAVAVRARARSVPATLAAAAAIVLVGESSSAIGPAAVLGSGVDLAEPTVVEFLRRETTLEDRILVESLFVRQPAFPGSTRAVYLKRFTLLPLAVPREFLGQGGTSSINVHRYASFAGDRVLRRQLATLGASDFEALLGRYAVSWIVASTPTTIARLDSLPDVVERSAAIADVVVFRVRRPIRSRFLEGDGIVRAGIDRIEVREAKGERLVLKYHWVPGMRTVPPLPIEEAVEPGMPVGFIAVRPRGESRFSIVMGRGWD